MSFAVAIIDVASNVVAANRNLGKHFGDGRGRKFLESIWLVRYFVGKTARQMQTRIETIPADTIRKLQKMVLAG